MEIKTKKRSKSYVAIMDAGKALFWKHGIGRVTVEEICEVAGVSKMTFYRNFGNKIEVAEKVLVKWYEEATADYRKIMDSPMPFYKKIHLIVQLEHDWSQDLSKEFINDIYGKSDPALKNILEEFQQASMLAFREDLRSAQEKGEIRKDLKLDFVIYMLNGLNEKMSDKNLVEMYDSPQELAVELANFIFYGIMPTTDQ
ncbi:TetR/AcrR family transcriptional regulator [Flavobacteriaceae bacterium F89]|uniref:TetR/AcrR family transcriptional regulator n=1 Tax=Cerina litoralis TaxID=2874477 RepID=A0AAE3JPT8_9FLAO|nr:TetR/AcrR family transcriptional regulator [Cerina litoralis]MCG2459493.1 TetR/AcrR family transcriptional regulator [Cerina litoralis]